MLARSVVGSVLCCPLLFSHPMKHRFLHLLVVLLFVCSHVLSVTAQYTKKIVMRCYDTYGTFLLVDSIVQPEEDCFYLQPPHIPFYTCKTYDERGSSACLVGGELNIEYTPNGLTGFKDFSAQPLDVAESMSLVLTEVHDGASFLWHAQQQGAKVGLVALDKAEHHPNETWIFRKGFVGWEIYNEAIGRYLTQLTPQGELLLGDEPTEFALKRSKTPGEAWEITDPTTSVMRSFVPHRYIVRPFFRLTEQFVDDKDSTLLDTQERLVAAGEILTQQVRNIRDFSFALWRVDGNEIESGGADVPTMTQDRTVDYVYRHVTALPRLSRASDASMIVDLQGRRVDSNYRGWVVKEGRVCRQ